MSADRTSEPDIDIDFGNRNRIIEYVEQKYGKDRVSRVGSLNFLRTKSAVKDVGRVLGENYKLIEELSNLVPPPVAGLWDSFQQECEVEPKLLSEKYAHIMGPVEKLWGIVRSYGTHAGGIVIAPGPINQFIPLYKDKDGNAVSQFDYRDLEAAGLLKLDILGLKTLEIIQLCLEYIKDKGKTIDLRTLEDRDLATYNLICRGDLDGIFQLGGTGIGQLAVDVSPKCLEDISLVSALYRPGPLSSGLVEDAVAVRQGKKNAEYLHELLIPILEETHSIPCYQEQVMQICTEVCGFTLPESYWVMKCMGKKLKEKLKAEQPKFVSGAIKNGVPEESASKLFEQLKDYGQYLFNKCLTENTEVILVEEKTEVASKSIKAVREMLQQGEEVTLLSFDPKRQQIVSDNCLEVIDTGEQEVFEVCLSDNSRIECTINHKFLCSDMKKHPLWEIIDKDLDIIAVE